MAAPVSAAAAATAAADAPQMLRAPCRMVAEAAVPAVNSGVVRR